VARNSGSDELMTAAVRTVFGARFGYRQVITAAVSLRMTAEIAGLFNNLSPSRFSYAKTLHTGPLPELILCRSEDERFYHLAQILALARLSGVDLDEVAINARTAGEQSRLVAWLRAIGLPEGHYSFLEHLLKALILAAGREQQTSASKMLSTISAWRPALRNPAQLYADVRNIRSSSVESLYSQAAALYVLALREGLADQNRWRRIRNYLASWEPWFRGRQSITEAQQVLANRSSATYGPQVLTPKMTAGQEWEWVVITDVGRTAWPLQTPRNDQEIQEQCELLQSVIGRARSRIFMFVLPAARDQSVSLADLSHFFNTARVHELLAMTRPPQPKV
jgi:hypothetical protein